jgi:4-amino-4-deoxy-L-arabinose transferase-like glycosyltransferase
MTGAAVQRTSWLTGLVDYAQRRPGTCLAVVLALHVVIWTALPILLSHNLQLDLAEGLALGREWQLGYWKLPPLPWWLEDALVTLTGSLISVYLLGPVASAISIYAVWRLGREITTPLAAAIAALSLEGTHFYSFSAVKFNHDVLQLPLWTLAAWFLYRALRDARLVDWLIVAVLLAGAFWTKYTVAVFVLPLLLFVLADATARRCLRTAGPYVAALLFLALIAPHLYWLIEQSFLPLQYADARAKLATHWYQFITFPAQWSLGQLGFLLPTLGLIALVVWRAPRAHNTDDFARRYVTTLALGPFAITTLMALVLGRLPVAMWGYPLWSFAPLALLLWFGVATDPKRLARFAGAFLIVFAVFPLAYAATEGLEPLWRDRPKATQFPGRALADTVTQRWREKFNTALPYVGGGEFATNNIAVYSADRPRVVVHADPRKSPWVDRDDLRTRGAVLVWEDGQVSPEQLAQLRSDYPGLAVQEPIVLPRQVFVSRGPVHPVRVHVALVPPRP